MYRTFSILTTLVCLSLCSAAGQTPKSGTAKPTGKKDVGEEKDPVQASFKRFVAKKEEALKAKMIEYKDLKWSIKPATKESPAQGTITLQILRKGKVLETPDPERFDLKMGKWMRSSPFRFVATVIADEKGKIDREASRIVTESMEILQQGEDEQDAVPPKAPEK